MARPKDTEGAFTKQLRKAGDNPNSPNPAQDTPPPSQADGDQTKPAGGTSPAKTPRQPKITAPQKWVLGVLADSKDGPMKPAEIRKTAGRTHGPDHMTLTALVNRGWISGTFTDG